MDASSIAIGNLVIGGLHPKVSDAPTRVARTQGPRMVAPAEAM
jgi:hypothetical protein